MKELIIYLLKSGLWIAIFWSVYWFFLKKDTFYKFNRYFLLTGLIASFILPFFNYHYKVILNLSIQDYYTPSVAGPGNPSWHLNMWMLPLIIYILGSALLLVRHFTGAWKIKKLIRLHGYQREANAKIVHSSPVNVTFSIFNYIFIDSSSSISAIERRLIYEHEKAHIEQCHWIDLLITHLICIVQWFNPFAWLYLQAIKQNHEFLADEAVLQKGNSPALYKATLINYTLNTPVFTFANAFAQHNKFKRIDMMMKKNSRQVKKLTILLLLPAFAVFFRAFAEPEYVINTINYPEKKELTSMNVNVHHEGINKKDDVIVLNFERNDSSKINKTKVKAIVISKDSLTFTPQEIVSVSENSNDKPLVIVDGKRVESAKAVDPNNIESVNVIKDAKAISSYGNDAKNGVIVITSKKNINEPESTTRKESIIIKLTTPDSIPQVSAKSAGHLFAKINNNTKTPLVMVDGERVSNIDKIDPHSIESISVLKNTNAVLLYGEDAKDGVVIIKTKKKDL